MTTHGLFITYILNPDSMNEKELSGKSNSDLYDLLVYLLYSGLTLEKSLAAKKLDDTQKSKNDIKKLETIRFLAFKLMAYFKFDLDTFLDLVPSMHQDFFMNDIHNLIKEENTSLDACRTFITLLYDRWVLKFYLKSMYPGKQNFKNSNNVSITQNMQDVYFVSSEVHEAVGQKIVQMRESSVAELEQCLKECEEGKWPNVRMPSLECFVMDPVSGTQQILYDRATVLNRDTFFDMVHYEIANFFFIVEDYHRAYQYFCKVKNRNQLYPFLDSFRSITQSMISGKMPRDVDTKDGDSIEKKTQNYLSSIIIDDENVFNFDPKRSSDLKKIVQVLKNAVSLYKSGEELYRFSRLTKYLIFRVNGLYEALDNNAKIQLLEKHNESQDDSEMVFEEGEINVEEDLLHDDDPELTLLEATDPMVICGLIPSITKHPISLNSRWVLPTHLMNLICQMPQINFYKCYIILAKAQELRNAGFLDESRTLYLSLFEDIQTSNNALAKVIGNEIFHTDLKIFLNSGNKDQDERRMQDFRIKCIEFLQSLDVNDYICCELVELVCIFQFKHACMYLMNEVNMTNNPIAIVRFCTWLAFLTHAAHNTTREIYGKELFEACLSMFISPNSKYSSSLTKINFSDSLPMFVSKLQDNKTICLVATCLMKIYNAIKDNPSQMVVISPQFDFYPSTLPPNISNAIEVRSLGFVVEEALRIFIESNPNEKHITRYYAEFLLAEGHYARAMQKLLRLMILKTEYFVNFKQSLDSSETLVQQMITCCTKLGHHVQAALLYQLNREPDYGHAFKELTQSNFLDSSDDLYECIWDSTLLEYLIHLHTRRGDEERLQKVLRLIAQLDLNSNNSAPVLQEAANLRKRRLFRMLCKQYM